MKKHVKMLMHLCNVLVCLIFVTISMHPSNNFICNAAPMNSTNKSTTANVIIAIEPESTSSSSAPLYEISRKKTTTVTTAKTALDDAKKIQEDYDSDESSEIYEIKLKAPSKKPTLNKFNKKNNKVQIKKKDENSEDLLAEFSQGYKKVYSKISHWWRDLESSFAVTPISYEGPSKKVKKDSSSFVPENKSKAKPTTKKPVAKKKTPPPKKKDQKQREPESWFDWNKVILVLGSIVTVLDLFGIR